tara:strand:- start:753 stop:938 length:186 start_codon:yes stop_codon:yes gene_type:complete
MSTFWFKIPGENVIAPIISIFLLEITILESNGYYRIIRPLVFSFIALILIALFFWKKKSRN